MDRDYFYRQQAREQQALISKELETRHLLEEAGAEGKKPQGRMQIALRALPIAIAMAIFKLVRLFA